MKPSSTRHFTRAFVVLIFLITLTTVVITWPRLERPGFQFELWLYTWTHIRPNWPPLDHGLWRYYQQRSFHWIENPISPYRLSESRRKMLAYAPPQPAEFNATNPPGVALLFLVLDGIDHAALWQRWMEDAHAYFASITNGALDPEKYIVGYLHHPDWVSREVVIEGTPEAFRKEILGNPADCFWGNLNPCVIRLLEQSYKDQPNAQWFMMVSADSVPLKSFAQMYKELLRDQRTRMSFLDLYFLNGMPRVSNWFVFSRKHAETLIRRKQEWMEGKFVFVSKFLRGAADEFDFFWPLLDEYREDLFMDINAGLQFADKSVAWRQMSTPLYACWRSTVCLKAGDMEPLSEPAKYLSLDGDGVQPLLDDPQIFFMRKVKRDAVFYTKSRLDSARQSASVLDSLSTRLNLSSNATYTPPHRLPIVMPPGYRDAGIARTYAHTAPAYGRLRRKDSADDL